MIKFTDNAFVAGKFFTPGMVAALDSSIEAELVESGNAILLPLVLSCLWEELPSASSVPPGTAYLVTNIGGSGGSTMVATLAGWVPQNGGLVTASNWGTMAASGAGAVAPPITGVAAGLFVPVGGAGSLVTPAGFFLESRSRLKIEAMLTRRGATATAQYNIYIGTTGTGSDSALYQVTAAATDGLDTRIDVICGFTEGKLTTVNYQPAGSAAGPFVDRTTNIDLTAAMTISFGVASANAADAFDLIGYSVSVISI